MRPVEKKDIGDTIVLEDGSTVNVQDTYCPHTKARDVLVANLGHYCSYCESWIQVASNLQVEHVQPKGYQENGEYTYNHLKYKWSNFLLSCATCNGKSNKSDKNVIIGQVHLPHLNNTFKSFEYRPAGVIKVNPSLSGESKIHAENLWHLVGFDKTADDDRIEARRNAWTYANQLLNEYEDGNRNLKRLMEAIKHYGFWSIWFTVFKNHDEVRKSLIDEFPGTAKCCFNQNNHYEPIDRNPANAEDPV